MHFGEMPLIPMSENRTTMDSQIKDARTVKVPSNRSFGLTFASVFGIIGTLPLFSGGAPRFWAWALGVVFCLLVLIFPTSLSRANLVWACFGAVLHKITSPIALAVVFISTFVPIGLVLRLIGKDTLGLKRHSGETYWTPRAPDSKGAKGMRNQF